MSLLHVIVAKCTPDPELGRGVRPQLALNCEKERGGGAYITRTQGHSPEFPRSQRTINGKPRPKHATGRANLADLRERMAGGKLWVIDGTGGEAAQPCCCGGKPARQSSRAAACPASQAALPHTAWPATATAACSRQSCGRCCKRFCARVRGAGNETGKVAERRGVRGDCCDAAAAAVTRDVGEHRAEALRGAVKRDALGGRRAGERCVQQRPQVRWRGKGRKFKGSGRQTKGVQPFARSPWPRGKVAVARQILMGPATSAP